MINAEAMIAGRDRLEETKANKAKRFMREVAEYRVETLQAAARTLKLLDSKIIPSNDMFTAGKTIEFLERIADRICQEKDHPNLPSL